MSPPTTQRRRARRGNALLEFVLTLPIIIFMLGLTITMAMAMLTRQQAIVQARHDLWAAANGGWSPMKLEGWDPVQTPPPANPGDMPRGTGDELDRLNPEVAPPTLAATSNPQAQDYWNRIWGNLPGRHHMHAEQSFKRQGSLWNFIDNTATSDHYRDSSPWHFYHLDAWQIARTGPVKPIFDAFEANLPPDVPQFFKPTRDDIINRWFHGYDYHRPRGGHRQRGPGADRRITVDHDTGCPEFVLPAARPAAHSPGLGLAGCGRRRHSPLGAGRGRLLPLRRPWRQARRRARGARPGYGPSPGRRRRPSTRRATSPGAPPPRPTCGGSWPASS